MSSKLSRREPDDSEFDAAIKEFCFGSDLAAAMIGSAMVENALMTVIKMFLDCRVTPPELFHDEGAPFGTFKARIVTAHAMKLITKEVAADLNIIRDIRNQFAHAFMALDFNNEHLIINCKKLNEYELVEGDIKGDASDSRRKFNAACSGTTLVMLKKANDITDAKLHKLKSRYITISDLVTSGLQSGPNNIFSNIDPYKF